MAGTSRHVIPIVLTICLLAACEGPTGPQGDRGEPGPQGEPGPSGIPGVTVVEIEIESSDFTGGQGFADATYPVSEIDQAVVDDGFVLGYFSNSPLPYEVYEEGRSVTLSFVVQLNSIRVTITDSSGGDPSSFFSGPVRFVIVDPTVEVVGKQSAVELADRVLRNLDR